MRALIAAILFLLAGCAWSAPHDATLRLEFGDGICSATAIGHNRILTASHCLKGAPLQRVGDRTATVTGRMDDGHDHSIITVDIGFDVYARRGNGLEQGQAVQWWGNPHGIADVYRQGVVAQVTDARVYIDGNGFMGDSGAALFDRNGRVVGVLSAIAEADGFRLMVAYPLAFTDEQWR